ncbi:hypothetical protein GCK72_025041 [Caenorhabditis remanei]|uniref:Uncharacterized protein n=1 Tax=Caenorhabditis remanei TaxID=31234 RepID=A0A6A5G1S4_CAERE|nr:hypothetical protein GCK72_025041 [Caenorhabditis remanei]KAF1748574.1 hypothetical protein GCK72_025041 [Caenorhabditis remanei]
MAFDKEMFDKLKKEWPEIQGDFAPDMWKKTYKEKHEQTFFKSVDLLQKIENLSYKEAEDKLLDVLVKVTFIEITLTLKGKQDSAEIFENLQKFQNDEPVIPFSTAEDVESFCDSMKLVFRKDLSKKYRNTGNQSKRFIQEVKTRLELGEVIDEITIDDVIQEFRTTVVSESAQKFAEMEIQLDFSSLRQLAVAVSGFKFEGGEGRLYLDENAANCLDLNLPIFCETIHFNHQLKKDLSRHVSGIFMLNTTRFPKRSQYFMSSEELFQTEASLYRQHLNTDSPHTFSTMANTWKRMGQAESPQRQHRTVQSRSSSGQLDKQLRNRKRWEYHLQRAEKRIQHAECYQPFK